jgi:cytochrome c oxidase subunit 1/cytochrome c oxidase subunit I+III
MPKITGKRLHEGLGRLSFWLMFGGFNLAFFPMHIAGLAGMPRRVYTYRWTDGVTIVNLLSSIGAAVLAVGILVTLLNIVLRSRWSEVGPDPWHGDTLEWTIPSPPPEYNFARIPLVTSLHPNWERPVPVATDDTLAEGHLTFETSLLDGDEVVVLDMPKGTLLPAGLAFALAVIFAGALLRWWWLAIAGIGLTIIAVCLWQRLVVTQLEGRQ